MLPMNQELQMYPITVNRFQKQILSRPWKRPAILLMGWPETQELKGRNKDSKRKQSNIMVTKDAQIQNTIVNVCMQCASCVAAEEKGLNNREGIQEASV